MNLREQQQRNMTERYRDTVDQREDIRRRQVETGTPFAADSEEQLRARVERLVDKREVDAGELASVPSGAGPVRPAIVFERILGAANELQSVNFLARGARAARAVARISVVDGGGRPGWRGTGFLVGERLLLTNNHVLPDVAAATGSFAEFDLESDIDGVLQRGDRYDLAPDELFVTDPALDYTLVAVGVGADGKRPGATYGRLRLIAQQGKIVIGEPVNIVGHPDARPKEVAVRANELLNQLPQFLHYRTDTRPGNSGSPVFNDQWEVVALHHASVPDPDGAGWIANEGVRVSAILRHLTEAGPPPEQKPLLAELGPQAVPVGPAPIDDRRVGTAAGVTTAPEVPAAQVVSALVQDAAERAQERHGLTGRTGAGRRIVFLHGRGQQGHDPAALRAGWCDGLDIGLAAAGLPPLDPADVWFPFYGDALASATAGRESAPVDTATTTAEAYMPADTGALDVYAALLTDAADRAGMPASEREPADAQESSLLGGAVAALQRPLSWIAARSGLDDVVIAMAFHDVAAYLGSRSARDAVLEAVLAGLPKDDEFVLVSHSLGTVVALDLCNRLPGHVSVPLLVTAGSPLGLDTVYERLLAGGPVRPGQVDVWVNAWAAADAVAIGCPLGRSWPRVSDLLCANRKDKAHDIKQYLSHALVAAEIGRAVRE
ncbi:serine protease [Streptomyces prunicolor]|uniref:trypsin-like serine peptidase n=1 Tax=Streptomyces prunicolor TaxID=67348 RepID=UPI00224D1731|nr:serine protease [Streptomyces prunicolor]MCX5241128.1 serine protease [Streptomyces prunicolor]